MALNEAVLTWRLHGTLSRNNLLTFGISHTNQKNSLVIGSSATSLGSRGQEQLSKKEEEEEGLISCVLWNWWEHALTVGFASEWMFNTYFVIWIHTTR